MFIAIDLFTILFISYKINACFRAHTTNNNLIKEPLINQKPSLALPLYSSNLEEAKMFVSSRFSLMEVVKNSFSRFNSRITTLDSLEFQVRKEEATWLGERGGGRQK